MAANKEGKMTRAEKSWIMYDWANSVYATIMMAAVFPIYFSSVAGEAGIRGDTWWGLGTSIAMLIIAVMAPVVGAFADYYGYKKKLFAAFLVLGLAFTALGIFTNNWALLLLSYTVSHIGFSGSGLVYDSFLPDVTTPERMDKVSSYGYAMGYIGGSTIPFVVSILLISFNDALGLSSAGAVKISLAITVLWWGLFSIPFLKNVKQTHGLEKPGRGLMLETLRAVLRTARRIAGHKGMMIFILAYFFYIDGVGTVITMSTAYGTTLGLDQVGMILALLVTQIVAVPCSIAFGNLSKKLGSLPLIFYAVGTYLVICIVGFFMGFGLEEGWFTVATGQILFWVLAFLVGTVQGGIQAISRSYFAKLVPPENAGEFFGFFEIFGKFAAVMGPALYAFVGSLTNRSSFAILSIILLFLVALALLVGGRRHLVR